MADKTTGGLPAVEEAAIGSLPGIADLYDDTLLPVEQQGEAMHMTGRQWKKYAQASVEGYADDAADSAQSAKEYSGKPPVIRDGTWWTWDAVRKEYVDTGEAARGNLMYATFYVDISTGDLYMVTDAEYTGPGFRLVNGYLEVVLDHG